MFRRTLPLIAVSAVTGLVAGPAFAGTPGNVTNYPLPAGSSPTGAAAGADGALWITLRGSNQIARMTTAGVVTTFAVPSANAGLDQIVAGPDGNLWFTEGSAARIGRITTAGAITEFAAPSLGAVPRGITVGPDGNLWFTDVGTPNQIGRASPAGVVDEFPVPGGEATDLTIGPDGNIWYTAPVGNRVGRMDPGTQAASEFFAPGNPTGMVTADPNSLWYTQQTGNAITRMTTAGTRQSGAAISFASDAIVPVADGNAWFTESEVGRVGFITPAAQASDFALGVIRDLGDPVSGPDGALWVPETANNRMARVDTAVSSAAIPPAPEPVLGKAVTGQLVAGTVLVKLPSTTSFRRLTTAQSLPTGTTVDAKRGTLRLTATSGTAPYSADFYRGRFVIAQRAKKGSTADMRLAGGNFKRCAARAAAAPKASRQLWGKGSGRFRTVGRFSAASVRGTTWLTRDTCAGTLTRVTAGSVSVRDFVRGKTVVVRRGRSYLARPRG